MEPPPKLANGAFHLLDRTTNITSLHQTLKKKYLLPIATD